LKLIIGGDKNTNCLFSSLLFDLGLFGVVAALAKPPAFKFLRSVLFVVHFTTDVVV
jgi:hypothetical protein